jgi:hypothetical protein
MVCEMLGEQRTRGRVLVENSNCLAGNERDRRRRNEGSLYIGYKYRLQRSSRRTVKICCESFADSRCCRGSMHLRGGGFLMGVVGHSGKKRGKYTRDITNQFLLRKRLSKSERWLVKEKTGTSWVSTKSGNSSCFVWQERRPGE